MGTKKYKIKILGEEKTFDKVSDVHNFIKTLEAKKYNEKFPNGTFKIVRIHGGGVSLSYLLPKRDSIQDRRDVVYIYQGIDAYENLHYLNKNAKLSKYFTHNNYSSLDDFLRACERFGIRKELVDRFLDEYYSYLGKKEREVKNVRNEK